MKENQVGPHDLSRDPLESYICADPRKLKTATDSVDDALFG